MRWTDTHAIIVRWSWSCYSFLLYVTPWSTCMFNHCLDWDKWVLTNFDHDRQWLTHLFHRCTSPQRCILFVAPSGTAISRLNGPVRLSVRYTTSDIHCRDRRYEYECDGEIKWIVIVESTIDHAVTKATVDGVSNWTWKWTDYSERRCCVVNEA